MAKGSLYVVEHRGLIIARRPLNADRFASGDFALRDIWLRFLSRADGCETVSIARVSFTLFVCVDPGIEPTAALRWCRLARNTARSSASFIGRFKDRKTFRLRPSLRGDATTHFRRSGCSSISHAGVTLGVIAVARPRSQNEINATMAEKDLSTHRQSCSMSSCRRG